MSADKSRLSQNPKRQKTRDRQVELGFSRNTTSARAVWLCDGVAGSVPGLLEMDGGSASCVTYHPNNQGPGLHVPKGGAGLGGGGRESMEA